MNVIIDYILHTEHGFITDDYLLHLIEGSKSSDPSELHFTGSKAWLQNMAKVKVPLSVLNEHT